MHPTYYLRTALAAAVGSVAAGLWGPTRRVGDEGRVAIAVGISVALSILVAVAFP